MKIFSLFTSLLLIITPSIYAQTNDESKIKKILNEQVAAWSEGNIEKFMQGYWKSDSLQFIGKSGITYGWDNTLENYRKRYPDTAAMGKLSFDLKEVKRLSATYFFVTGKWHLARSIGDAGGHFTLLFRKMKGQWFIVADHSS